MTQSSTDASYVFVCPDCDERIIVDVDMRQYILAEGCAVCGADVAIDDFEHLE